MRYIACKAQAGHQATLKLGYDSKSTNPYTILPGEVYADGSEIMASSSEIKADEQEELELTYKARDFYDNAVSGLGVTAVNLTDVQIKLGEFTDGDTNGVYKAKLAGSSPGVVRIMPQVKNKNVAKDAAMVILTALPDKEKSSFIMDSNSYTDGDTMILTALLKDINGNPVSKMADTLNKDSVVNVPNTIPDTEWTETVNTGEYTAKYRADVAQTGLIASLKLPKWNSAREFEFSIAMQDMSGTITAGDYEVKATHPVKFPVTAYVGATFKLNDNNFGDDGVSSFDLTVTCGSSGSNCDWVKLNNDGTVIFNDVPNASNKQVQITAIPKKNKDSKRKPRIYTFTIGVAVIKASSEAVTFAEAEIICKNQYGSRIPGAREFTSAVDKREPGTLWSEWGNSLMSLAFADAEPVVWIRLHDTRARGGELKNGGSIKLDASVLGTALCVVPTL